VGGAEQPNRDISFDPPRPRALGPDLKTRLPRTSRPLVPAHRADPCQRATKTLAPRLWAGRMATAVPIRASALAPAPVGRTSVPDTFRYLATLAPAHVGRHEYHKPSSPHPWVGPALDVASILPLPLAPARTGRTRAGRSPPPHVPSPPHARPPWRLWADLVPAPVGRTCGHGGLTGAIPPRPRARGPDLAVCPRTSGTSTLTPAHAGRILPGLHVSVSAYLY
jgi:hypothetical protein